MKIKILGTGCAKCQKLAANVEQAIQKLGISCDIQKITDINEITAFGVMTTPALVFDEKVVSTGKLLTIEELEKLITLSLKNGSEQVIESGENNTENDKLVCSCDCACETETGSDVPTSCGDSGKKKNYMTIVLLIFVVASIIFMIVREVFPSVPTENNELSTLSIQPGTVVVYYFHGNQRCFTCNQIESLTQEALKTQYAKELADEKIIFKSVNVDEPNNEHFIKDFELSTRNVVVQRDGKYENLDAVWSLVKDKDAFIKYIQSHVAKMLDTK